MDEPRFVLIEELEGENVAHLPSPPTAEHLPVLNLPSTPLPSTETADIAESGPTMAIKKKGTASTIKKGPKRARVGGESKKSKKAKAKSDSNGTDDGSDDDDDESDNGPYCLCRGPDDHRWMICCEKCEDWFHGECVNISKETGENLIEKFVCPNCSTKDLVTIYKKTCGLPGCRKAARLVQKPPSVFCSGEHAQTWWERMLIKLPKGKGKSGFSDQLSQEEMMALLNSHVANVGDDGAWKLSKAPFSDKIHNVETTNDGDTEDPLAHILTDEEKKNLKSAATSRFHLEEETLLCHKMLALIEMVQERRRSAINSGQFGEDICGYDQRLDTISARDAFAAFVASPEGEVVFQSSTVGDPLGEDDQVRGMCERKRCKVHSGWQKMLALGVRHQIREMADQAAEVEEDERILRVAAKERWRRRQAERNWVEVIET